MLLRFYLLGCNFCLLFMNNYLMFCLKHFETFSPFSFILRFIEFAF